MSMSATGRHLTAEEAAIYCGVSLRTVQRWLAAGTVTATREGGRHAIPAQNLAPLRRVTATADSGPPLADTASGMADTAPDLTASVADNALVAHLEGTVADLRAEVERLHERLREAHLVQAQLAAVVEQRALPAPVTAATGESQDENATHTARVSRPWYQRWLAWWRR